jgi:hypothetical protein
VRTVLFLVAGLLLLAAFLVIARLFSTHYPAASRVATVTFIAAWLVVAVANLYVGVTQAGYSVGEEAPIALLVFALPAIVAVLLEWRFF